MRKCPRDYCYAPDATCRDGEDDLLKCEYWLKGRDSEGAEMTLTEDEPAEGAHVTRLPWSGNTLGLADLEFVASRHRPHVVGIAGPQNAGKTTFLAMVYLLLRRGHFPAVGQFAGSYSLGGWEQLARYFEWKSDAEPEYPPHTAADEGRRPGLLHLSFRSSSGARRDTLWTDAPGEWFQRWSVARDTAAAAGARWTYEHADSLLLFADSGALAGEKRGSACANLELLTDRLGEDLRGRKVALVWAKSDIEVPNPIRRRVEGACAKNLPTVEIFRVNVPQENLPTDAVIAEFIRLMTWLLIPMSVNSARIELPVAILGDPLLAFRGRPK